MSGLAVTTRDLRFNPQEIYQHAPKHRVSIGQSYGYVTPSPFDIPLRVKVSVKLTEQDNTVAALNAEFEYPGTVDPDKTNSASNHLLTIFYNSGRLIKLVSYAARISEEYGLDDYLEQLDSALNRVPEIAINEPDNLMTRFRMNIEILKVAIKYYDRDSVIETPASTENE